MKSSGKKECLYSNIRKNKAFQAWKNIILANKVLTNDNIDCEEDFKLNKNIHNNSNNNLTRFGIHKNKSSRNKAFEKNPQLYKYKTTYNDEKNKIWEKFNREPQISHNDLYENLIHPKRSYIETFEEQKRPFPPERLYNDKISTRNKKITLISFFGFLAFLLEYILRDGTENVSYNFYLKRYDIPSNSIYNYNTFNIMNSTNIIHNEPFTASRCIILKKLIFFEFEGKYVLIIFILAFSNIFAAFSFILLDSFAVFLNGSLKILYTQPRPFWTSENIIPCFCSSNFGNPSTTALDQFIIFMVFYKSFTYDKSTTPIRKYLIGFLCLFFFISICLARLLQSAHTVGQIILGMSLGYIIYYFYFEILEINFSQPDKFEYFLKEYKKILFITIALYVASLLFHQLISFILVGNLKLANNKNFWKQTISNYCDLIEINLFENESYFKSSLIFLFIGSLIGINLDFRLRFSWNYEYFITYYFEENLKNEIFSEIFTNDYKIFISKETGKTNSSNKALKAYKARSFDYSNKFDDYDLIKNGISMEEKKYYDSDINANNVDKKYLHKISYQDYHKEDLLENLKSSYFYNDTNLLKSILRFALMTIIYLFLSKYILVFGDVRTDSIFYLIIFKYSLPFLCFGLNFFFIFPNICSYLGLTNEKTFFNKLKEENNQLYLIPNNLKEHLLNKAENKNGDVNKIKHNNKQIKLDLEGTETFKYFNFSSLQLDYNGEKDYLNRWKMNDIDCLIYETDNNKLHTNEQEEINSLNHTNNIFSTQGIIDDDFQKKEDCAFKFINITTKNRKKTNNVEKYLENAFNIHNVPLINIYEKKFVKKKDVSSNMITSISNKNTKSTSNPKKSSHN